MRKIIPLFIENKKRLINIAFYFIGLITLRGSSLILTPLYTRVFTTGEYGVIELANTLMSFLTLIIGVGLCQYIGIEYFHFTDRDRSLSIVKNIKLYLMLAFPVTAFLLLISSLGIIQINGLNCMVLNLVIASSFTAFFSDLCLMLCKNQQKTNKMIMYQFITGIFSLIFNIIGVCVLKLGIYSTLISTFFSNVIFIALLPKSYPFDISIWKVTVNLQYLYNVLKVSIPLVFTGIVNVVLTMGDRWILNYYCSTSEVGIYSIANKFANVYQMFVINILTIFYSPSVYKAFQEKGICNTETKNRRNQKIYWMASLIIVGLYMLAINIFFPILIDARYEEAKKYIFIMLMGQMLMGAMYMNNYLINYTKRTNYIFYMYMIAVVVNLITNFVFIPQYGILAATMTTTGSYLILYCSSILFNHIVYRMRKEN